jgi:hypothetical protein
MTPHERLALIVVGTWIVGIFALVFGPILAVDLTRRFQARIALIVMRHEVQVLLRRERTEARTR